VLCQPTVPLGGANTSGQLSAIPLYLKKVPAQTKEDAFIGAVSRMNAVRLGPEASVQHVWLVKSISACRTANALHRKYETSIPRNETKHPRS
jgi:hypothetical protein